MARKLIFGGLFLLGLSGLVVWGVAERLPARAGFALATALADSSSGAGFSVRQVELSGVENQPRLSVYQEVLRGGSDSMFLLDLQAIRARLVVLPWVKDARVERRWPDRIDVHIDERQPAAIWQEGGQLRLIDIEGTVLDAPSLEPFAALPQLVGPGADKAAQAFLPLLHAEPGIAQRMEAAIRVGDRRWDLRMKSGETLSLPEGRGNAADALRRFAAADRVTSLLGQGFLRFDLRIPGRMIVRVPKDGAVRLQPSPPSALQPAPPATARTAPGALPGAADGARQAAADNARRVAI